MFNIVTISTVIVLFLLMIGVFSVSIAIIAGYEDKVKKFFPYLW